MNDAQASAHEDIDVERAELRRVRIEMLVIGLIAISPLVYIYLRGGIDYALFSVSGFENNLMIVILFLSIVFGFGTVFALAQMQGYLMAYMGSGKAMTFSRREKLRRMAKMWLLVGGILTAFALFGLRYNHYV